ncbi:MULTISPECIES: protein YgfX [unclassified Shewanella]|uniref:protein YgfX n=1 Tax=unclassified Shewanella TaxID=196818 RepID=UPI000C8177C1|nr:MULTISPECIES: protein YgfX [unclassified Shewanella]MDO6773797.1 hypothetical protein [Shewanella sp. 3_MG-2023]PMG31403.1 hypothetical protein BCU94_08185 [Shewanella sp. 10N.286.52.C2]PMG43151.1 hypothetical protein BCU91_06260 [Shewanella sp. 10N.286.52.B9]PMI02945.1 hypothetical protein BCU55_05075 [Shewanella sp. 10N.286.48.A6]
MHFSLSASFNQFLSHIVLLCVCLSSFILWPDYRHWAYQLAFYFILISYLAFFVAHLLALRHWRCQFSLLDASKGKLSQGQEFQLWRSSIVTVFAAVMFIELDVLDERGVATRGKRQLLIVWSDMLDDSSYRNLCRQLIAYQKR